MRGAGNTLDVGVACFGTKKQCYWGQVFSNLDMVNAVTTTSGVEGQYIKPLSQTIHNRLNFQFTLSAPASSAIALRKPLPFGGQR